MQQQVKLVPDSELSEQPPQQVEPAPRCLPAARERPRVEGRFLFAGTQKLWIKGVTYGSFEPDADGEPFPSRAQVAEDFRSMARRGINAVRTYTVAPRWLLDLAGEQGLRVMVGIPWEQHVAFLDDRRRAAAIETRARAAARGCAGHPALLCYALGNEIPASIVRWHGRRRVERFIERLYRAVKQEDPGALATYVNFPTTEYLQLPFLDFVSFNVYLESRERLEAYLARLHNLAEERPLLMAEVGLDSRTHGEQRQAETLDWQIRSAFRSGCAGAFVFAWTDQWHRGGHDIQDWDFGLTTRQRAEKPALRAVARAFAESPFPPDIQWPKISVVVCSYNGARTIHDTLDALQRLSYPDYEVIVVNDGSTDETPGIAAQYGVRLISTENRGLSNARNTGYQAARGDIVAYIDDDAYPDPDWAHFLAITYLEGDCVGVGGPNLAPRGDGDIAHCVAHAPGGPVHVLLSDTIAEHIPGCNMSFRKSALEAVGGFDPRYRAAGDDVDLCWRIQEQVGDIAFHPSALVWHHRRNCLATYWKQQQGYGKAEALLEQKWPQRYNVFGHATWSGRLYGRGLTLDLGGLRSRVYQGVWGSAPFQSLYQSTPGSLSSLSLMPEWYLLAPALLLLSLLGLLWQPLLWVIPVLLVVLTLPILQALVSAWRGRVASQAATPARRLKLFWITVFLHLEQPLARLIGRLRHGLSPWRRRGAAGRATPLPRSVELWREQWREPSEVLWRLQQALAARGATVGAGDCYDAWDLQVRGGLLANVKVKMVVEEHGAGRQMFRFRRWPAFPRPVLALLALLTVIAVAAGMDGVPAVSMLTGLVVIGVAARAVADAAAAAALVDAAVRELEP